MNALRRLAWWVAHALLSLICLGWALVFRRRCVLLFTHWPDVDHDGRDRQMGPLVDALRRRSEPFFEVTLVPGPQLFANLRCKRRPFVSLAVLHGPARVLAALLPGGRLRSRVLLCRGLLWALRPRVAVLIDESGSGQALLQAARRLHIRVLGIQHGDFQPDNPQYTTALEPADALCVWSPWFRDRLLRVSPIYDASKVRVTGRLRDESVVRPCGSTSPTLVLLLSENRPDFAAEVAPFLAGLRATPGLELRVRPHPAEPPGLWASDELCGEPLSEALLAADIVVGVRSSALLEALFVGRPTVILSSDPERPAARALPIPVCADPASVGSLCLDPGRVSRESARGRDLVWGGAPADPVAEILASLEDDRKSLPLRATVVGR